MGNIVCKYIDPPRQPEKAIAFFKDTFIPLVTKYWETKGKSFYGAPLALNLVPLAQTWLSGSLVMVLAYDDKTPIGFFCGVRFIPMLYNTVVLQGEVYYGPTPEIEQKIINYVGTIIKFMNVSEFWLNEGDRKYDISGWDRKNTITLTRFLKE